MGVKGIWGTFVGFAFSAYRPFERLSIT